jgi:hypothetical protein
MRLAIAMATALGSQTIAALPPPIRPHEHVPPVVPNWELHSTKVSCPQIGEVSVILKWQKWHVNIVNLQSNSYFLTKNDTANLNTALSEYQLIESIHAGCLDDKQFAVEIKGLTRDTKPKMVSIRLQGKRLFLDR